MKNKILVCLAICTLLLASSCEDSCVETNLNTLHLDDFGCNNGPFQLDVDLGASTTDAYIVIDNEADFNTKVNCSISGLDFSQYDLIIGKKGITSGVELLDHEFAWSCNPDGYKLTVFIYYNLTDLAGNITYHAIVPKMENPDALEVEFIFAIP